MATTPHPPPPKPAAHDDPQAAKLELAAHNAPVTTALPPGVYESIGDEQRARSVEMEAAGGPEAWMEATASGATGATGATRSAVVPGVGYHETAGAASAHR